MTEYKVPEIEKIEYSTEDILKESNEDNNTVSDINELLNEPTAP